MTLLIFVLILGGLFWWFVKTFDGKYGHKCFQLGNCFEKCPWCGVYGFYSPKETENKIMRCCKWCGVWQKFEGEPYRCVYLWCQKCSNTEYTKENLNKPCQQCGDTNLTVVKWPVDLTGDEHLIYMADEIKKEVYMIHQYRFYPQKINAELVSLMLQ